MQKIGIFFNPLFPKKSDIFEILSDESLLRDFSFFSLLEQINYMPSFVKDYHDERLDAILVFGGDGTILKAVKFALDTNAPLLGINLGKLGFLTDINLSELLAALKSIKEKKFRIQQRILIDVSLRRKKKIIFVAQALNDAVIYKGPASRLIDVRLMYDNRYALEARCDGFIVSTPTGSTAYSLSAGGPIMYPEMEALIVTPLNPHVLSVRPMVFSVREKINVKIIKSEDDALLQIDGENLHVLLEGDEILIESAQKKIGFIKLTNKTFYQILRKKLHLGRM
ncbi:MAG: NAD(+)/NADH kinase [Candidatus Cloacimonetes bacterium]|nr:NAD(+)/NADH kinase [Candidatus Cloacimonadota bacterium]